MALLPVDEALTRILEGVTPLEQETAGLLEAGGRTLAAGVTARLTQPPFDASAMDGYAVRSGDVARLPAQLHVIGESKAGEGFHDRVGSGQAVRIFTGAPVPEGADAIVIQENTDREHAALTVHGGSCEPGAHIRPRGQDFASGQVLLRAGRRLTPRDVLLAAAMGHGTLPVCRKPVVAILATGDELVEPGFPPLGDQIVGSNSYGLAAMVQAAGADVHVLGIARDQRDDIEAKIAEAGRADILVTTGGASVGDHDLVAPVLKARGVTIDFWKIAMRPGKPMMFGTRGRQRILGLPGNPVAAMICGRVFLTPLIEALLGRSQSDSAPQRAILAKPLPANGNRLHFMRCGLHHGPGGHLLATPHPSQDSSLVATLAAADGLIVSPIDAPALPAGAEVDVLTLDF